LSDFKTAGNAAADQLAPPSPETYNPALVHAYAATALLAAIALRLPGTVETFVHVRPPFEVLSTALADVPFVPPVHTMFVSTA
jgi:hypothetical protein